MVNTKIINIFRKGSKTYFLSSIFLPMNIREDVFILYAFVRVADNYVDAKPQQTKEFASFRKQFEAAYHGYDCKNIVIDGFVSLMKRRKFKKYWVDAFLDAMESDLYKKNYSNMRELNKYMYGSAEVVGLMMAAIMQLPKQTYPYARKLGKAMQFANFIRDIDEDNSLGRSYLPHYSKYGLSNLTSDEASQKSTQFRKFIKNQIKNYWQINKAAEKGFRFIPKQYLIAIKTANEMYRWTMREIEKDPLVVFSRKVKPSKLKVINTAVWNSIRL